MFVEVWGAWLSGRGKAMAADGVSQREIARRLGINRRTVKRLVDAVEPPSYARAPAGSMLDPLEAAVLCDDRIFADYAVWLRDCVTARPGGRARPPG